MRDINSAEIFVAVNELMQKLKGNRLKNFYDLSNDAFRFVFEGNGQTAIYLKLLKTFNETRFSEEAEEATQFAMAVRKRVKGARLESLTQHNSDRIIVMQFSDKDRHAIIIEMFAKGNIAVVSGSMKIEAAYRCEEYRDRKVRQGAQYIFPKSEAIPFGELEEQKIGEVLATAEKGKSKLIVELAKHLNFGPLYLEDIIRNAGLNPNASAETIGSGKKRLEEEIRKFYETMKNPNPALYLRDGIPMDFAITQMRKYETSDKKRFTTLGELLDGVYIAERGSEVDAEKEKEIMKLGRSIEKQRGSAKEAMEKSAEYRQIGNKIFEHMNMINTIIEKIRKKEGIADGNEDGIRIKGIDKKNKVVKVELETK